MKILETQDTKQDIYLIAGDVVTVPKLATPLAVSEEKYIKLLLQLFHLDIYQ